MSSDNKLIALLLSTRIREVIEPMALADINRIISLLTESANWKVRRNASELLGTITLEFRTEKKYAEYWKVIEVSDNVLATLLETPKTDENESVQRSAASALSQSNQWPHIFNEKALDSFRLDRPHSKFRDSSFWYWTSLIMWAGFYALAGLLLLPLPALSSSANMSRMLVGGLVPIALIILNSKAPTPMSTPEKTQIQHADEEDKWILTHFKLIHLWNMLDEKADLAIRKKLQDPFRIRRDKGYWKTFRDPTADQLAYETLKKIESFRDKPVQETAKT